MRASPLQRSGRVLAEWGRLRCSTRWLATTWLFSLALAAWPAGAAPARIAGLRCLGAQTMQPLLARWARGFQSQQPDIAVEVGRSTRYSAAGVAAVLAGTANCVSLAREAFPAEVAAFQRSLGQAPLLVPVAGGSYATPHGSFALAVYVNRANPLRGLSLPQLATLFSGRSLPAQTRPLTTWGQLGLHGVWADRPIHLYGMTPRRASGNPPGIVNFLDTRVLQGRPWRADLRVQVDTTDSSALTAIVRQVGRDPDGIGYSGFGYADGTVRALPLAVRTGAPYVAGSPATVASARYPLAREIYLGFPPGATDSLTSSACRFMAYVLSRAGQRMVARDGMRFMPLTLMQRRDAHAKLLHDCTAAAHPAYLTADGAVRIVGYNDMRWMLQAIDRRYLQRYPGARFRLILHGTRTAPAALASGRSLFAPMGAPFLPTALAAYRRQVGTEPLRFRVAHAALDPRARSSPLAIYVNISNPLSSIDMEQLRRSFTGTEPLATWSQLGLGGTWARRPIHPCGLAPTTALGRYMRLQHFGGTTYAADYIGYAESAQVLARVAADPDALCIADLNQAVASVRTLGIRLGQGQGISIGSSADIVSGRYPLDRYLYIYVRAPKAGVSERMVCRYLRLLLSDDGQRLLAAAAPGYLPLSQAQREHERQKVKATLCNRGARPSSHSRTSSVPPTLDPSVVR